jgi:hypothetical protein
MYLSDMAEARNKDVHSFVLVVEDGVSGQHPDEAA